MIDHVRFIAELGTCYQLHVESFGPYAEHLHRRFTDDFYKAMRLRYIRRRRPTYLRLVNIQDRTQSLNRVGYHYVSDIVSPSLALLAEMCPAGPVDIDARKISACQIMRCFNHPVEVETVGQTTQRLLTRLHPLEVLTNVLVAYPKLVTAFRFGLCHTVYTEPHIDDDDYFSHDPMPFRYKRMTRFQPIHFTSNDLLQ